MNTWKSACGLALIGLFVPLAAASFGCEGTVRTSGAGTGENDDDGPSDPSGGDASDTTPRGIGTRVFALCASGGPEVPAPRLLRLLTRREYKNTLRDLLYGQEPDVSSLPLEPRVRGFDNNTRASVVTSRHADEYLALAQKEVERAVKEKKGALVSCQQNAPDCRRKVVESFGLRAFRRPLSADEVARYEALFGPELTQNDFDEGLRLVMTSMLVSPSFLYRSEVGEPAEGGFRLTPYEVASALSYLYWGSMPDQNLLDAAAKNQLGSKAELEAQARRLLADDRAKAQVGEFSLQWLGSDGLASAFKDKDIYPSFSDGVRTAMLEEQRRFVADVALGKDGKFAELFTADYVHANGELARFYGLTPQGDQFAKLSVTRESQRGGLLGLGAVLAAHAHSNESSPIRRGLFVRDRLLCQDLPPPPASLDTTPPGLDPTLTTRARFAKHTESSACRSCHQFIDGVGFGLEGFDGVGQRRAVENGHPIDTSGELRGLEGLTASTMEPFSGPRELAAMIAESSTAESCLTVQFFRHARGYEETESDACALAKLRERFQARDLTLKDLLVNIVLLDSFTQRRGE
ncbi:MAG: DUF1592 domain-containing protein [Polyangiales bacterium]